MPFYIGGRLADGSDATNPLTTLIVEEYIGLNINDPKIHVRWHKDLPKPLVRLILGSIRDGRNSFVFLNDEVVEGALTALGEDPADARNYVVIGCYEPAALGKEVPCTCAARVNLPKAVLVAMNGGIDPDTGAAVGVPADPDSYRDFDAFYAAVLAQIGTFADRAAALTVAYERAYPSLNPAPLFSSTLADCVARGKDAYSGGAKYNNSAVNAIFAAMDSVKRTKTTVPPHLQDAHYGGHEKLGHGIGYKYAHDYPNHYVHQQYLPTEIQGEHFYELSEMGYEKTLKEYQNKIKSQS